MSDRIIVMGEGQIRGVLSREEANQERIMSSGNYRINQNKVRKERKNEREEKRNF